jgi:hypothetical protein
MTDPQQTEHVAVLEHQANEAQLIRNNAKDQFEIAQHRSQLPNIFRWRHHTAAFIIAGVVGTGGSMYALKADAPYMVPVAAGAGLSVGLASNALDDRKQKREKHHWLEVCRYDLGQAETQMRQCVAQYREEEEIRWLMYALDIRKAQILTLREWMADPRRTMKDAIAESIDIVTTQFLKQPPDTLHQLAQERDNRQLRQRLFSETLQVQKDEFANHVFSKHNLLRDQELQEIALNADLLNKGVTIAGGTAAGLIAGTGLTAMGAGVAGLGSSKIALVHAVSNPLSFAATVGVGILAAGTLNRWMSKRESDRRQRESQQFHDAFTVTTQILEALTQAQTLSSKAAQHRLLQQALEQVNALKGQALKRQDPQLKEYVQLLGDRLQACLHPASTPLRNLQRLFTLRVS